MTLSSLVVKWMKQKQPQVKQQYRMAYGIVNRGIFYRLGGTAGVMRSRLKQGNVLTVLTTAAIAIPIGISFYEGETIKLEEWLEAGALRNTSSGMKPYRSANEEMKKFAEALMGFTQKTPVTLKDIEYPQELDWVNTHLDEMISYVNQMAAQEWLLRQELEQVRQRPYTLLDAQD